MQPWFMVIEDPMLQTVEQDKVKSGSWIDHSQVREAFSVQQSQGLDSLMAGLDPQALDLLKVCLLDVYQLHVSSL